MSEPPQSVGAPSDLAAAEEMPGCITGTVKVLYAIPYFLFWELPTLPLDLMILAHEKGGRKGLLGYLALFIFLVGAACWWLIKAI